MRLFVLFLKYIKEKCTCRITSIGHMLNLVNPKQWISVVFLSTERLTPWLLRPMLILKEGISLFLLASFVKFICNIWKTTLILSLCCSAPWLVRAAWRQCSAPTVREALPPRPCPRPGGVVKSTPINWCRNMNWELRRTAKTKFWELCVGRRQERLSNLWLFTNAGRLMRPRFAWNCVTAFSSSSHYASQVPRSPRSNRCCPPSREFRAHPPSPGRWGASCSRTAVNAAVARGRPGGGKAELGLPPSLLPWPPSDRSRRPGKLSQLEEEFPARELTVQKDINESPLANQKAGWVFFRWAHFLWIGCSVWIRVAWNMNIRKFH